MALKEIVSEVYEIFTGALASLDLLQEGFIYSNLKRLEEAGSALEGVRQGAGRLAGQQKGEFGGAYACVPSHVERVARELERMVDALRRKAREDVLFSDKALNEVNFMFEKTRDILSNTRDMVLARNTIIGNYLVEAEHALGVLANDFSTRHEERLIEGLCLPKSSAVYIELLDAFKSIAWHAKEIAVCLMKK
ncbi:MAG: hypothetical protein Kow0025_24190 [Thermodesulfovibrionales bacterium]